MAWNAVNGLLAMLAAGFLSGVAVCRADDTARLQALLDSGTGRVEFPDGTFVVSRPLRIGSDTHLICSPRTVVRRVDAPDCLNSNYTVRFGAGVRIDTLVLDNVSQRLPDDKPLIHRDPDVTIRNLIQRPE